MSKSYKKDLTSQHFGRLTVLEFVPNEKRKSYWLCQCDCGKRVVVGLAELKTGDTVSCGCKKIEQAGLNGVKHRLTGHRIYTIWRDMKSRCYNVNDRCYKSYGGRGIMICEEWKNSVKSFYEWSINNGYNDELTIDRIDTDGDYEPNNCRWISNLEQQRNKRNTVFVEYNGTPLNISKAAELVGIKKETLRRRYHKGDRGEKLFRPVNNKNK